MKARDNTNKIKTLFCLGTGNNGFELDVLEDPDTHAIHGELTRIENYLAQQNRDSDPLPYPKRHDPEQIDGATVDEIMHNAKSRIQELAFETDRWKER